MRDILTQDEVVAKLEGLFGKLSVVDRREHPSHGYRAVHVVVDSAGKLVEIQIRTSFQHLWAELSEKLSDLVDSAIKYGGGDELAVSLLANISDTLMAYEVAEAQMLQFLPRRDQLPPELQVQRELFEKRIENLIIEMVAPLVEMLRARGLKDDLSD